MLMRQGMQAPGGRRARIVRWPPTAGPDAAGAVHRLATSTPPTLRWLDFYGGRGYVGLPAADTPHQTAAERQALRRAKELEQEVRQLRARQRELEAQANHDELTGLANRKLLQDRFRCAAERAKRSGQCFALLMIDLDRFKTVNDTHGHAAGDRVLVTMARRMVAVVRTCDTVARLGGDEFVLIVESIHDPSEIIPIGRKLVRALLEDIVLDSGVTVAVGASLGLALYPYDGAELSQMLDVADRAMYECKSSGQMELQATPLAM